MSNMHTSSKDFLGRSFRIALQGTAYEHVRDREGFQRALQQFSELDPEYVLPHDFRALVRTAFRIELTDPDALQASASGVDYQWLNELYAADGPAPAAADMQKICRHLAFLAGRRLSMVQMYAHPLEDCGLRVITDNKEYLQAVDACNSARSRIEPEDFRILVRSALHLHYTSEQLLRQSFAGRNMGWLNGVVRFRRYELGTSERPGTIPNEETMRSVIGYLAECRAPLISNHETVRPGVNRPRHRHSREALAASIPVSDSPSA